MTDYHPLIARAVEGLTKNTGEARRALYERARAALVAQLRGVDPPLSESEITKERLALEEAVRKVESEAARKALAEPRSSLRGGAQRARSAAAENTSTKSLSAAATALRRSVSAATEPPQAAQISLPPAASLTETDLLAGGTAKTDETTVPAKQSARARILEARAGRRERNRAFRSAIDEIGGLGSASARAVQSARDTRDTYTPELPRAPVINELPAPGQLGNQHFEPDAETDELQHAEAESSHLDGLEQPYSFEDEPAAPAPRSSRPLPPPPPQGEDEYVQRRPPRSYRGLAKVAVVLILIFGVAAAGWSFRSNLAGMLQLFSHKAAPANQNAQTPPDLKFGGRVPQQPVPGQTQVPGAAAGGQQTPVVAQHAVLYEADPKDPQGKRFPGSVIWRTETVSPGPGLAPELAIRADIAIPERNMTVTWSLRRNTDKALPASHTIEIMFNLPPDFPGGAIANVPGILMKDSEEVRGMPLAGLAVKVTNGFFLIGLNAADEDLQRNLQLLKERSWFDVLLVYSNGGRAILTLEKGPPGERAFADALAAWGQ